jgi:hypothetical protein
MLCHGGLPAKYPNLKVQVECGNAVEHWFEASDVVKSGILGDIHLVKAWIYKGYDTPYPVMQDSDAPANVDYDMWLGPAPKRPFNLNRFHYNFRWWWDYAGGAMTDWGVHLLDLPFMPWMPICLNPFLPEAEFITTNPVQWKLPIFNRRFTTTRNIRWFGNVA